uniref:ZP domain-containing protein n=1 Tax=Acrobeloides nanus TaxID=290746 RepID=A0A914CIQ1_9BILA
MVVNLSFEEPFDGMVYAQNHYQDEACKWPGNGGRYLLIIIPLGNLTLEEKEEKSGFCGLTFNRDHLEHSITLVIMPEPMVLTADSFGLVVRCIIDQKDIMLTLAAQSIDSIRVMHTETMTVLGSTGSSPQLLLQILDGHGLTGDNVTEAYIGQRLTLDTMLEDTSIYDMFVYSCRATDGTSNPEASLSIVDSNGCAIRMARAIDAPVFTSSPVKNAAKHVYVHIYGFQFTSSEYVHFECYVTPCFNSCQRKQCEEPPPTLASVNEMGLLQTPKPTINLPTYTIKTILKIVSNKPLAAAQIMIELS